MVKTIRGTITEIVTKGSFRGPLYCRVTTGSGPGRMILLNFAYHVAGLKVGDKVEVEIDESVVLGLTARKVRKMDP